jgi:hypothetical protein
VTSESGEVPEPHMKLGRIAPVTWRACDRPDSRPVSHDDARIAVAVQAFPGHSPIRDSIRETFCRVLDT